MYTAGEGDADASEGTQSGKAADRSLEKACPCMLALQYTMTCLSQLPAACTDPGDASVRETLLSHCRTLKVEVDEYRSRSASSSAATTPRGATMPRGLCVITTPEQRGVLSMASLEDEQSSIEALQKELCSLQEEVMSMPSKERKAAKPKIEILKRRGLEVFECEIACLHESMGSKQLSSAPCRQGTGCALHTGCAMQTGCSM